MSMTCETEFLSVNRLDFTPEGFQPSENSYQLAYHMWGDISKPQVWCVHGLARNGRDFDFLAKALVEHGFCVVCPDMPGRGKSEWLSAADYHYPQYVNAVKSLWYHLKVDNAMWIGTSMGGLIGMMLAAEWPDKIPAMVLNDIGPFIPAKGLERVAGYVGVNSAFSTRGEIEGFIHKIMTPFGVKGEEQWQHIFEHSIQKSEKGTWQLAYDPAIGNVFRDAEGNTLPIEDVNLWPLWDVLTIPRMLVIRGEESDILRPETMAQMVESKANCESISIAGVGHAPMLMNHAEINTIIGWLRNQ